MVNVSELDKGVNSPLGSPTTPPSEQREVETHLPDDIDSVMPSSPEMENEILDSVANSNGKIQIQNGGGGDNAKNGSLLQDVGDSGRLVRITSPDVSLTHISAKVPKDGSGESTETAVIFSKNNMKKKGTDKKEKEKKKSADVRRVGFFQLFRFSSKMDKLLMVVGTLGAIGAGCVIPVNFIIYGNVAMTFIQGANPNVTSGAPNETSMDDLFSDVSSYSLQFCLVGMAVWLCMYLGVSLWTMAAESQMVKIRHTFFRSVLRQEIGWFDTHDSGELGSRMADDLLKIGDAMGDKMGMFIQWITIFIAGYVMALVQGWKLALAVMSICPILIFASGFVGKVMRFYSQKEMKAYAAAGSVAEEVLYSIRTVAAFHGQEKESERYYGNLHNARKLAIRKSFIFGFGTGCFWLIIFGGFAIAFIFGVHLYQQGEIHPGIILQVFFGVLMGSMSLGHAFPNLESFALARAAAATIFDIIDRKSSIDSSSAEGKRPEKTEGNIEFKGIEFTYPSRPDVKVLSGLDLTINVGQTVALVGASGCGKSTTVQLLQRFYDPDQGQVLLDGHDLRELNVSWLRQQIGVVSQEPVLFATTIAENIRFGKDGVTQQEVEAAAKEANAHQFIMDLPLKYETQVGERGAQLSGGQKQNSHCTCSCPQSQDPLVR